ncbi:PD-(D/E)XK nuclease family protein [Flavobacterium piscisymbiosum]|uniref:PD-(D/E)XK nuclease family protein n=1 Tax=Flavobacterium piscisymbiosum TaxID=2893753 RepID=A0ABS8MDU0_9FLAO|nr:PD-(D/E)XK nuclease family protein [Flavobacterium sp. F-30]MCC9063578.1 PD-(D/E)XK nuclease family protein [Flavobacterium sp. F-30]
MTENTIEEKINLSTIKNLLENVHVIQNKYDDIADITGEKFNVFSVLNLTSNEVRTHSAFIGELLNIKGSHGLKDIPLQLFIKILEEKFILNQEDESENKIGLDRFKFNTENAITIVEKNIKKLNEDKTEGGRIDIIVEDKNKWNALIIENKIYAGEQENQLIRYYNYCKEYFLKETPILYLTLDGSSPTSGKGLIKKQHYFNISYKEDIINWLELCLKEASDKPMLREVMKQYIYLIKKLTGQTINKKMSEEIQNIILRNFSAAEQIVKEFDKIKYKISGNIRNRITEVLISKLGSKYNVFTRNKVGDTNSGIWLELKDYENTGIYFGIEPFSGKGNVRNELFFGILDLNDKHKNIFQNHNFKCTRWWRDVDFFDNLEDYKNNQINFSDSQFISFLGQNPIKQDELINKIAAQMIEFIQSKEGSLINVCKEINGVNN